MKLVQIESQPDFPLHDISEVNAAMLELLILNPDIFTSGHENAELRFLYRLGHGALNMAAMPHLDEKRRQAAFSHGIGTYEVVSTMVRPQIIDESPDTTTLQVISAGQALSHDFAATVSDARDKFTADLPRTAQLIGASASRFYPGYTDYALSGAATARELEVSTRN